MHDYHRQDDTAVTVSIQGNRDYNNIHIHQLHLPHINLKIVHLDKCGGKAAEISG